MTLILETIFLLYFSSNDIHLYTSNNSFIGQFAYFLTALHFDWIFSPA